MIRDYNKKEEEKLIKCVSDLAAVLELFDVELDTILYTKKSNMASLRFNHIHTYSNSVSIRTSKDYKRRIYNLLTEVITETLLKDLK